MNKSMFTLTSLFIPSRWPSSALHHFTWIKLKSLNIRSMLKKLYMCIKCVYLITILSFLKKWLVIVWLHIHIMWSKSNLIVRMKVRMMNFSWCSGDLSIVNRDMLAWNYRCTETGATFVSFIPELKAQYDYGMMIFILTFCLVTVLSFRDEKLIVMAQ